MVSSILRGAGFIHQPLVASEEPKPSACIIRKVVCRATMRLTGGVKG